MLQSKSFRTALVFAPGSMSRVFSALVCTGLLLTAVGCKKAPKDKTKPADATSTAVAAPGKPCEELSKKACGVAGDKSGTCNSVKAVVDLLSDATCAQGLKDFAHTEQKLKSQSSKCDELVEKLCAGVGKETGTCKMVSEKTKRISARAVC